ncbi:heterokaryon incompatibility protein-domain-containing protein [Xylogone sp. PMI_703]|nr:heterokaryon incompatibility protein-domain-containing protein [Xylogone sp. PMI_703]
MASQRHELCGKCLALTGTLEGLEAAYSREGYAYCSSAMDLELRSERCPLCKIIWDAMEFDLSKANNIWAHAVGPAPELLDRNSPLTGFIFREYNSKGNQPRTICILDTFTEEDDPASNIITGRPVLTDVRCSTALEQACHNLSDCLNSHTHCAANREEPMPIRVLDVGVNRTALHVRLYSTKSGQTDPYIALSYCWGNPSQQEMTTIKNLTDRIRRIDLDTLPQTLQDAVYITRSLGVRYLWIDAFCIIQNDSEDRAAEINKMGRIYRDALFTISATSCVSVRDGFLHKRSEPASIKLPFQVSANTFGSVKLASALRGRIFHEALHRRGWTLQEHILSRRVLLFTEYEMLWQCATEKLKPVRRTHIVYPDRESLPVLGSALSANLWAGSPFEKQDAWFRIVELYSSRGLSQEPDKINALVGIATELSNLWKDIYLMGLWYKDFIHGLAWSTSSKPKGRLSHIPTWSWLSLDLHALVHYFELNSFPDYHQDARLITPPELLQPIITNEHLADFQTVIRIRAQLLRAVDLEQEIRNSALSVPIRSKPLRILMDLEPNNALPNDTFIMLLGYSLSKGYSHCLVLDLSSLKNLNESDSWL